MASLYNYTYGYDKPYCSKYEIDTYVKLTFKPSGRVKTKLQTKGAEKHEIESDANR